MRSTLQALGAAANKANAERFAANIIPIIREIQTSGVTTLREPPERVSAAAKGPYPVSRHRLWFQSNHPWPRRALLGDTKAREARGGARHPQRERRGSLLSRAADEPAGP